MKVLLICLLLVGLIAWFSFHSRADLNAWYSGGTLTLTGTVSNAPIKLVSSPLMTNITPGTLEYLDHTVYFTTYLIRRSIQLDQAIVTAPTTVSNSVAETTIYTIPMASNYITAGKVIVPKLSGIYWAANPQTFTLRLKHNASTLLTTISTSSGATAKPWECIFTLTAVTDGAGGTMQANARMIQDTTINMDALTAPEAFDTTTTNTISVTVQWSATGANSLQLNQGYTECIQ